MGNEWDVVKGSVSDSGGNDGIKKEDIFVERGQLEVRELREWSGVLQSAGWEEV